MDDLRNLLWLIVVLAMQSCSVSDRSGLKDPERLAIERDIRSTLNRYYADIKKTGLTAEFAYLDSSDQFFWVPPGSRTPLSYDSVVAFLKVNAPRYTSVKNSFDTLRIIPLTRELATYTAAVHSAMTDTAGTTSQFSLIESGVLVKRKEKWKLLSGQTSIQ
jgi:hypothetical protein